MEALAARVAAASRAAREAYIYIYIYLSIYIYIYTYTNVLVFLGKAQGITQNENHVQRFF